MRWGCLLALTAASALGPRDAAAQSLDVDGWLQRPGVKLVVVEFFATWCKPCMEAVPRWKELHDRYRNEGLRFIVVSTRDAQRACASPGWTPDEVVCDDDGFLADRFGANPLPAAYLWNWQGQQLAQKSHVDEVEAQIEAWMRSAPRVDVMAEPVPPGAGIETDALREAVRSELGRLDKAVVVATERERESLRALVRQSLELGRDDTRACEVGKEMSANSLVKAVITPGASPRLQLQLFSAERGCLVAAGTARWNPDKASVSLGEATVALVAQLRLPETQFPWTTRAAVGAGGAVKVETLDRAAPGPTGGRLEAKTSFLLVKSEPPGATVLIDGKELGVTPFQDLVPVGARLVEVRLGELYGAVRKRIDLGEEGAKLSFELPKQYGVLDVRSTPSGAAILIDGEPTGEVTPHVFPKRKAGTYTVELKLELHKSVREKVRLSGGATTPLVATLPPNYGDLSVTSQPSGLEVVLDGTPTGERTPARFERLAVGVHEVELLGGGERMGLARPRVSLGETVEAHIDVPDYEGLLRVAATHTSGPVEADVYVNGRQIGSTPLQVRHVPGDLEVEVRYQGAVHRERVRLEPRRTASVSAALREQRAGVSVARSDPSGGGFDGTPLGWTFLGIGAASGVASLTTFLLATSERANFDTADTSEDLKSAVDRTQTNELAAGILLGVAGGFGALGVLFHVLDDDGPKPTAALTPNGGVVGMLGSF